MKRSKIIILLLLIIVFISNENKVEASEVDNSCTININEQDEDLIIKVLTDDEMISMLVERGLDEKTAISKVKSKYNRKANNLESMNYASNTHNIYLSKRVIVSSGEYEPRVEFFCEVEAAHGQGIVRQIHYASLNRKYKKPMGGYTIEVIKHFSGNLYYTLVGLDRINFNLNGDFYNYGDATVSSEVNFGVVNFSVTSAIGHYKYVNIKDDIYTSN